MPGMVENMNPSNPEDKPKGNYLPVGSSRQVIRREFFKRSCAALREQIIGSRSDRREFAKRITKSLWQRGERLTG